MVSNTLHSSNPLICSEKRKSFIFPVFQIKYFPAENTGIMVRFSRKSVYFYLRFLSPDCPAERKLSISTARTNKRLHTAWKAGFYHRIHAFLLHYRFNLVHFSPNGIFFSFIFCSFNIFIYLCRDLVEMLSFNEDSVKNYYCKDYYKLFI